MFYYAGRPPPSEFVKFYFFFNWKKCYNEIVQNYKASWNSSKFIETPQSLQIFVTLFLSSTSEMAYPVSNELREIFSFLTVYSL